MARGKPKQGDEGAPNARVQIEPDFLRGLDGIEADLQKFVDSVS